MWAAGLCQHDSGHWGQAYSQEGKPWSSCSFATQGVELTPKKKEPGCLFGGGEGTLEALSPPVA